MSNDADNDKSMARFRTLAVFAAIAVVGLVIGATYVSTSTINRFFDIRSEWIEYDVDAEAKGALLNRIRGDFGYGGLIHAFKNYVLRRDSNLIETIELKVAQLRGSFLEYEQLGLSNEERRALLALRNVVGKYEEKLAVAIQLVTEGGTFVTSVEIDRIVKVDDQPAFDALHVLGREWMVNRETETLEIENAIALGTSTIQQALLAIPLFVLAAGALLWFLRRIMRELSLHASRLQLVLDNIYDGIFSIDENGNILSFSPSAEDIFEYSQKEVLGKDISLLIPESLNSEYANYLQHLLASKDKDIPGFSLEVTGRRHDGSVFPVELSLGLTHNEGHTLITGVVRDVTERKLAEEQLLQSSKMATLGETASGITHELNQPLNIIRMATESSLELLEEGELDDCIHKKKLERIGGQIDRMSKIIDHMRVFSRHEKSGMEEVFSPGPCIENIHALFEKQFSALGITLESDISASDGLVRGAPVRLEQVVMNLLINAKDAITERAKTMAHDKKNFEGKISIEMVEGVGNDTITILVTDNGGGIPQNVLSHIFDPFYTTKEVGKGTGLGLSISYKIIESMGGVLNVHNIDGGTRFEIALPLLNFKSS